VFGIHECDWLDTIVRCASVCEFQPMEKLCVECRNHGGEAHRHRAPTLMGRSTLQLRNSPAATGMAIKL